ncbi:MAG TPA: hypothetical protein P5026_11145 [Kiritimatiellia bacterium]|nr:hypothetical protein [Kiritimatiellia bacterium]HRU71412.1 hypothetical protein [Kiritimatiellia bacterium]
MNPSFLLTLSIAAATALHAAPILFDFGTADSPLYTGAQRVTEKGGDNAQWESSVKPVARAYPIQRDWKENTHTRRKDPPASYHTELTCDHVASDAPAALTLAVPAGAYRLVLLCGRAGGRAEQVWDICVTPEHGASAQATFAGPHELRALTLDAVTGTRGIRLDLTTRSRWALNAVIAVQAAEWEAAQRETVEPLLRDALLLPRDVLADWKIVPRPDPTPEPVWSTRQQQDGVAVYARPWCDPVWPDHKPRQHELDAPVRAFATPGEYEPLTFTLHARRAVTNVDVRISALAGTNGRERIELPASDIDVRYVRYMFVRPNYNAFNTAYRAPDVLMPWQPQPIPRGENLRLWLTVRVSQGQPAGLYHGCATVTADHTVLEVPLTLRVLPITLLKDRSLIYGQYYRHPLPNSERAPDAFSRAWWQRKAEAEHVDMREHGMNTVVLGLSGWYKDGRWQFAFDTLQRNLDLARGVGFDKPFVCSFPCSALYRKHMNNADMGSHLSQIKMPPDAFFEELTWMVQTIEAEARRRQWPELLYYPVDEPSTSPDAVAFMTRVMAAIKKVPSVRTYVTADPGHEQFAPMRPYVDVWCCQPFSLGREAVLADMKSRGVEYWCYPNHISGENDHTPTIGARMTYGFGFWQSGYRCLIPWIYQSMAGDPWSYLDASTSDFFNRTADDGTPIPVTLWEAYREGIDDHRYLFTLETAIARAEAAGRHAAASRAREVLTRILETMNIQPKYKHDGLWSAGAFDAWRWALAEQIMALQADEQKQQP